MAKLRPMPKTFDELVKAFRLVGKNDYQAVARIAGTTATIARVAWTDGFPSRNPADYPMPAIKESFEKEALLARSARARATTSLIQKQAKALNEAVEDAAQQRAIEGMAARSIMVAVDAFAAQTVQLVQVFPKMQAKISALIEEAINDDEIPLSRLQQIITWSVTNLDMLTKAMEKAQIIERKFMGEADSTVRIIDGRPSEERLASIASTLMMLKGNGHLELPIFSGLSEAATTALTIDVEASELTTELDRKKTSPKL